MYTEILYAPNGAKLALMSGQTVTKMFVPLPAAATAVYAGTTLSYYRHPDWLGSSRVASTSTRTIYYDGSYAPFGESYNESGTTDRSFTGQNQDLGAVQYYDFLYREHNVIEGRWISPDPAGLAAVDPSLPQTWNRYAYVANSPLNLVDPLGMDTSTDCPGGCQPIVTYEGGGCYSVLDYFNWQGNGGTWAIPYTYEVCKNGFGGSPVLGGSGGSGGSGGPGGSGQNGQAPNKGNVFTCASTAASKVSIAGGLQALGIGTSGVGGFVTNALGGNTFSGITDFLSSFFGSGSAGGHSVFYNMGQSALTGPLQGIPGGSGPWGASATGFATEQIAAGAYKVVTGAGQTIQTLNGAASISSMSMTAGEFASGVGLLKFGYDAASYVAAVAACAAGLVQ